MYRNWGLSSTSLGKYYFKTNQNKMALHCKSRTGGQEVSTPGDMFRQEIVYNVALCLEHRVRDMEFFPEC